MRIRNQRIYIMVPICISLMLVLVAGCTAGETPAAQEPTEDWDSVVPSAVRNLESLGYSFTYHTGDDTFWQTVNTSDGWTARIYDNGAFAMSGSIENENGAQMVTSIDYFEALGVTPAQSELIIDLVGAAMESPNSESANCDLGLCCATEYFEEQGSYFWYCKFSR